MPLSAKQGLAASPGWVGGDKLSKQDKIDPMVLTTNSVNILTLGVINKNFAD